MTSLFPDIEQPKPVKVQLGTRDPITDAEFERDVKPRLDALPDAPKPKRTDDAHKIYLRLDELVRMHFAMKALHSRKDHPRTGNTTEAAIIKKHVNGLAWAKQNAARSQDGRIEVRAALATLLDLAKWIAETDVAELGAVIVSQLQV